MAVLSILIIIKAFLFATGTNIEYDIELIIFITSTISILIILALGMSNLKNKKLYMSIFYSLISIIMLIDVLHFAYFGTLPPVKMATQAGQLTDVTDSIKALFNLRNLMFIIDIPFVIYYLFKYNKDTEKEYDKKMSLGIPMALLSVVMVIFISANSTGKIKSLELQELYTFHFTDIKDTIKSGLRGDEEVVDDLSSNQVLTQEDLDKLRERTELIEGEYTGIGEGKNLIVLQVEALQNFIIGLEHNGQEITPNINKLIKDKSSIYYDNYYQQVGRGNTSDAEFVSNNSLYPSMERPSYDQYPDNTYYGLPWALKDEGYTSWAFHGFKREFWNREKAYPNQGFTRYVAEDDFEFDEEDTIGLGINDEKFFEQTLEYLKELDEVDENPFYAFIISLTSHNPFDMPEEYHVLDIEEKYEGTILGDYLQSIHYTDKYIGEFIEGLKEEGLYEDSVIALYGDHFAIQNTSEEIHEIMEDFLGKPYYYDEIMNVPLVIHVPGEDINHTNSKVGSQLDFYPTILNIMGYENKKGIVFGRDLNHYEGQNYVAPQTMLRKGSFITEDIIFEISRTEIFDHSKATNMKTGKEIDIYKFRDIYDQIIKEINQSNFILKNDVLKHYIENDGKLDLDSIKVEKLKPIKSFYHLDAKDLEGYNWPVLKYVQDKDGEWHLKPVEVEEKEEVEEIEEKDNDETKDKDKKPKEDEDTKEEKEDDKKEEYKDIRKLLSKGKSFTTDLKYKEKEGVYIGELPYSCFAHKLEKEKIKHHIYITTESKDYRNILNRIGIIYPDSKTDYVVEIDEFDKHYFVTQYGYENIVLDLRENQYTEKEVKDFIKVYQLYGVIIEEENISSDLIEALNKKEVLIYKKDDKVLKLIEE